jgi:hypothetical protein
VANCSDGQCSCLIHAGTGIVVTGSGTQANPYIISSGLDLSRALTINDTPTLNLTLTGSGVITDPFILKGDVTLKLQQLTDVQDPEGGPAVGDVPVWVGVGSAGHFEFRPPPANPAGAANTSIGLTGDGSLANPIKAKLVSETAGATTGLAVYVDTAGNLRATQPTAQAVDWSTITNKPTTFALSAHTHSAAQITDPLNLSVGDSVRVGGIRIFVQSSDPTTGMTTGDLRFW